jgi:hypothetical protein
LYVSIYTFGVVRKRVEALYHACNECDKHKYDRGVVDLEGEREPFRPSPVWM